MSLTGIQNAAISALQASPVTMIAAISVTLLGTAALLCWFAHQPKSVRADIVKLVRALRRSR